MKTMLYKEKGAVKWCLCKVIAEYEDRVWIHNLHSGTMPMGRKQKYEFKEFNGLAIDLNQPNKL